MVTVLRLAVCLAIIISVGPMDVHAFIGSPLEWRGAATSSGEDDSSASPDATEVDTTQTDIAEPPIDVPGVVDAAPPASEATTSLPTPAATAAPANPVSQPVQLSIQPTARPAPPPGPLQTRQPTSPTPKPVTLPPRPAATRTASRPTVTSGGHRANAVSAPAPPPSPLAYYRFGDSSNLGVIANPATHHVFVETIFRGVLELDGATGSIVASNPTTLFAGQAVGFAMNLATNRAYLTSPVPAWELAVVDTAAHTVITKIALGTSPRGVAVNSATNRIYIAGSAGLIVVDGASNTVLTTVNTAGGLLSVAVDERLNRIFAADLTQGEVAIDGATNSVISQVPEARVVLGVDSIDGRVFARSPGSDVVVVDSGTNTLVVTLPVQSMPTGFGVDTATHLNYFSLFDGYGLVLDGTTLTAPSTFYFGAGEMLALDSAAQRLYGRASSALAVFDTSTKVYPVPQTVANISVGQGPAALAFNPLTNRVYSANSQSNTVSVFDTVQNLRIADVPVGMRPDGVAVNTVTNRVYISNYSGDSLSVLDGSNNTIITNVSVGHNPSGVGVNPSTGEIFVANSGGDSVSILDGASNTVKATVSVGLGPDGLDVNPNTNRVYVANAVDGTVSVINAAAKAVIATITVQNRASVPRVDLSTNRVYVANAFSGSLSAIDMASNSVIGTVYGLGTPVGIAVDSANQHVLVGDFNDHGVAVVNATSLTIVAWAHVVAPIELVADAATSRVYVAGQLFGQVSVLQDTLPTDPVCSPRPNVTVSPVPQAGGQLQVTVSASGRNVVLQSLRFAVSTNGLIDVGGAVGSGGGFTFGAMGMTSVTFTVRRALPGQTTTVPFVVVDSCGEWSTFVGGGPSAF